MENLKKKKLNQFAALLKVTQQCESTTLQLKKKVKLNLVI